MYLATVCQMERNDRYIAFASRTLNSGERNYSQTDKQALVIVLGVKKFHFLFVR